MGRSGRPNVWASACSLEHRRATNVGQSASARENVPVTDTGQSQPCSMERAVAAVAGGALVFLGMRGQPPWRYVYAAFGLELIRRGVSGRSVLYRRHHPGTKSWKDQDEKVDEMSRQSFPASDAPAY